MDKILILLVGLVSILFSFTSRGQDVIVMRNGDEVNAKVTEVGQTEIKYVKYDNLTGPTYSVKKSEVFMIRYANGSKDVFKEEKVATGTATGVATDDDVRRAKSSATFGYILAAPILILGVASAGADDDDAGIALGAAATLIGGVGIPIVGAGPRRTRSNTGVVGNRGLRIAGWIGYGVAMADALYLLAISEDVDTGSAAIPVAILGATSAILFAVDASQTASQAQSLQRGSIRKIHPMVGMARDRSSGKLTPTIGVRIRL